MYGADPRLAPLGTKTGCRRLFGEVGVPYPLGAEDLHSLDEVAAAIDEMLVTRPTMTQVIVKLNEGVSGTGNALVDLAGVARAAAVPIDERRSWSVFAGCSSSCLGFTFDWYVEMLESDGGIVEERIVGEELLSPSVQLRARPDGSVELLSTHDQLLGGASGQSYLGCTFPADAAYSRLISEPAAAIGERLAKEGVIGRFAVDFVVVRDAAGEWSAYAIELNLRKGGTTHPFLTLQFLTDGSYDAESGRYFTREGAEKHLVATDHLEADELRALSIGDLFDVVARHGLHFDQVPAGGHRLPHDQLRSRSAGRVGMTAVGDTPEQAMQLYDRAREVLLAEARAAGRESALPD